MKERNSGFRLRLNFFDCLVLLAALAVGAWLVWSNFAPKPDQGTAAPETSTVRYTVRLRAAVEGTGDQVQPGDALVDAVKNYAIGSVISSSVGPAKNSTVDQATRTMYMAEIPLREDVELVVEAQATENDAQILVGGGFEVRAGLQVFVRGPGYMGSGYITAVERMD